MESFGAKFPKVFADPGFKGWFVSVILLSESHVARTPGWGLRMRNDADFKKRLGLARL